MHSSSHVPSIHHIPFLLVWDGSLEHLFFCPTSAAPALPGVPPGTLHLEFCFLSQSARVVCDFSRRIVPLGIFMATRWDVTALWGPAEQTEPLPDLYALGWQPLSLSLALEVQGSPRNQGSSR